MSQKASDDLGGGGQQGQHGKDADHGDGEDLEDGVGDFGVSVHGNDSVGFQ